ncbi:FtsX-like permease family protein [Rhodanobacter glycinis]|uniref:FtsX-like permease family protein n=1 Tax=Rhodanobacter glycinis TaxID=582702 RepID=A0A502C4S6_9GAMM|nr:FtsX-like permease family protein [Rhodanobacter glycinis]TPG08555.1 FtsX-like permease family protein [Rhodanobacter glycinis]
MTLHPMIAALRRHKAGVVLIALQIALTLAIVCNAVFIIGQRIERVHRPTGLDENNLFLVSQQWVGAPSGDDPGSVEKLDSMQQADLAALRGLPDVASVAPINSLPLLNSSWNGAVDLKPGDKGQGSFRGTRTTYYFSDEQALSTLGLRLVAGRTFTAADVGHRGFRDQGEPSQVILTKALGDKLFPKGDALGKVIFLNGATTPTTIIGLVERMQVPGTGSWTNAFAWNATLVPTRLDANFARYAIRAKPGRLDAAMHAVTPALYATNPLRVLDDDSVKSFADIRAEAYRADVGMAILMGVVCLILLAVTAAGIVGLTSFWVGQRHRQIGVRRALGARKIDILHYFQIENLVIASVGAVIGLMLAVGLNLLLMKSFEMDRLPAAYVLIGIVVVLALGQGAVFVPARRASNVPPVVATRAA